jgi:hypothetical protein
MRKVHKPKETARWGQAPFVALTLSHPFRPLNFLCLLIDTFLPAHSKVCHTSKIYKKFTRLLQSKSDPHCKEGIPLDFTSAFETICMFLWLEVLLYVTV